MSLLGRGLLWAAHARGRQLDRATADPRGAQLRTLARLLVDLRRTAFGRAHHLRDVYDERDLRERVPIQRYEDLDPWIRRAWDGEPDVLWPGRVHYFARSSGTSSGADKLLPITDAAIAQQRRGGFDPVAAWLRWTGDATLFDGKAILLGGSSDLKQTPSGARFGVNTGVMANHIPFFVRHVYRPSAEVRRLHDWDEKLARLVDETIDEDVRLIAGTPSWFPGLFDRVLEEARRRGRAARTVRELWPNLRLLTGGGINFEPYRPILEARFGGAVPYVDVYNSTEAGIMGVQDRPDDRAMRLLPDAGTFYEFVPLDRLDEEYPPRLALWEIEADVPYAVVVTSLNGMVSYAIGDVLRFVETTPARFVFEGRTAAFLNVHGEKLSQRALERTMAKVAALEGIEVADFTVSAAFDDGRARHVWWVEARDPCPGEEDLARRIDEVLRADAPIYASHRAGDGGLGAPCVRRVPLGGFHGWMRARGRLGGQNKVPRVVQDPADETLLASIAALRVA